MLPQSTISEHLLFKYIDSLRNTNLYKTGNSDGHIAHKCNDLKSFIVLLYECKLQCHGTPKAEGKNASLFLESSILLHTNFLTST